MNYPHPKPIFMAPVVDARGVTVGEQIEQALNVLRGEHEKAQLSLRDELTKAHARLEVLEARWHEKLLRWVRGQRDASV
jgi:hypothetical protein